MNEYLQRARQLVDTLLPPTLAELGWHPDLRAHAAYVMVGGGKALRPALLLWSFAELHHEPGEDYGFLPDWALALEMVHCYSLVHDDLPAMDNDDYRRGKETLHKLHGDAVAILAGDALLTGAFEVMVRQAPRDARVLQAVRVLARAAGAAGMVSGQLRDMTESHAGADEAQLERVHAEKTGALMAAALELGAIAAFAEPEFSRKVRAWGVTLGLYFQVVDDLLDATRTFAELGKTPGKDSASGKRTYVSLLGADGTRAKIASLRAQLLADSTGLYERGSVEALLEFIARRTS